MGLLDNDAAASICMIADFVKYDDPDCNFPANNEKHGIKARAYCQNPSTVRMNFYNVLSEDWNC